MIKRINIEKKESKELALRLGSPERLDIAWLQARKKLVLMVGPVKGSQGTGEGYLPDSWIDYGRRLYGPDEPYPDGWNPKKPYSHHAPWLHENYWLSEDADPWHFIAHALVFTSFCQDYIQSAIDDYNASQENKIAQ